MKIYKIFRKFNSFSYIWIGKYNSLLRENFESHYAHCYVRSKSLVKYYIFQIYIFEHILITSFKLWYMKIFFYFLKNFETSNVLIFNYYNGENIAVMSAVTAKQRWPANCKIFYTIVMIEYLEIVEDESPLKKFKNISMWLRF